NDRASPQPLIIELPPPADLVVDAGSITLPGAAQTGDTVQVTWTVRNLAAAPAKGRWTDAVYLSADAVWDVSDRLLGTKLHSGDLARNATYAGTLSAPLPPLKPGQCRVIVRTDVFNEIYEEGNEGNNQTASSTPLSVTVPRLELGVPLATTLSTD